MKYFTLAIIILLGVTNSAEAISTYCIRNNVMGSFYLYDKNGNKLGEVETAHHKKGISADAFPLTVSWCGSGPNSCSDKVQNHVIKKKDCYIFTYYLGTFRTTHFSCFLC